MYVHIVQYKYPDTQWQNDAVFTSREVANQYIEEQTERAKQLLSSRGQNVEFRVDPSFKVIERL